MVNWFSNCFKYIKAGLPLIGLIFLSQTIWGQIILKGQVTNKHGAALSRINILVYLPDNQTLVAFAISDENGNFYTKVKASTDSLIIKVSSIQYSNERRVIPNTSQILQFELKEDIKDLEGITVKAPPVEKRGDTLSYMVKSFVHAEDRAIEDVLRRMPGIVVEANGQILYQGTPINKFYVEGLDLMEGRYSLVSKNLPQGSVTVVEILENHQPIQLLEDKVESQQAALNLKIKKGITTTGTAQLGAGLTPFLWEVNVTPMTFTKKLQVVTSLQSNNTGNDVSQQLQSFTLDEFKRNNERPSEHVEMLDILSATPPEINSIRYLDNNIFLFNFNGLQRINTDFKLRTNIYYTYDNQKSQTTMLRTIYTPVDTLQFSEKFNNRLTTNNLYANFSLNRNVKKNFLNNDLKIQGGWNNQYGMINADGNTINQALKNPLQRISNELRSYNPIGKHIWEFQSYVLLDNNPNSLGVTPGQFEDVLNYGTPYNSAIQRMELMRFYTDNSAGLVLGFKSLTISPRLGISYLSQTLLSNILVNEYDKEINASSEFTNDIVTQSTQTYLLTGIEYKTTKLTIKENISLNRQQVDVTDKEKSMDQEVSDFLINNRLSVAYKFNGFWQLFGSWGYNQHFIDYDEIHSGFIMRNYRNLSQNMIPISINLANRLSSRLEYRNQIISFFNTIDYVYSVSHTVNTNNDIISDDGSSVVTSVYLPKTNNTHYLQAYSSKFFSTTKTTISLRINYILQQGKSMVNNESFKTKNNIIIIKPEISIRLSPWMNLEYNLDVNNIFTFIDQEQKSKLSLTKHNINFFIFPVQNQLINFTAEYYNHNSTNSLFIDLFYRYTITSRKIDIEVKCNNIFNSNSYTSYLANTYSVWETTYLLRPFQVIFSVKFSF